MSENWYVVHTQPRGEKMLKALLDREPAVVDTYLPMRQQFAIVGGQRVSRMALTMPGLVFVRGNKNQLVALLREKSGASRLMVDSSRKEKDAMVVADSEMTAFRLFNDNTAGQLMMLRSPFCNFTSATLAPEALAAEGAAIISEILASVRARRWRTLLYAVCLR